MVLYNVYMPHLNPLQTLTQDETYAIITLT